MKLFFGYLKIYIWLVINRKMDCENHMDSENQIKMCVKETVKVEPAGLGFGVGSPDRRSVPQGLQLSSDSLRKKFI